MSTTVWMHHLDTKEMPWEKARWNCTRMYVLLWTNPGNDTLYKIAVVGQLTSHLTNCPRLVRYAGYCWWGKDGAINDCLWWTPTHRQISPDQQLKTSIHKFCVDTGYRLGDLLAEIYDWDRGQEIESKREQVRESKWEGEISSKRRRERARERERE